MNQLCYRLVFNRARGLLMAVAETTPSHSAAGSGPRLFAGTALTGLVSTTLLPVLAYAQIIPDAAAPAARQAIVSSAANGVPLVHIQMPTAAGVSRNVFSQFDVQSNGAILNNANQPVQTSLGGWVQANPLLSRPASVIVNEINSSNASLLHGYVEIAGQAARLIIANPSGISCDGCGFINASRATLTTGIPQYSTSGNLDSYLVRRGTVSFSGDGLDAKTIDFTDV
ncbi:MAG: filamentous hemagglutinin N-terminal domain-containing protein, partial [Burkholderiaceae bacterium]